MLTRVDTFAERFEYFNWLITLIIHVPDRHPAGTRFLFPTLFQSHVNIRFARLQIFITVCQVKLQTTMQKMILQMIYIGEVRVDVALEDSQLNHRESFQRNRTLTTQTTK